MAAVIVSAYIKQRQQGTAAGSPTIKFTQAAIKELPAADFEYEVRIEGKPTLRCRMYPSGTRSFVMVGKPAGSNKAVRINLGRYGRIPLTIKEAKHTGATQSIESEYTRISTLYKQGINPRQFDKEQAAQSAGVPTLGGALKDYLEESELAVNTVNGYTASVNNHLSDWKGIGIDTITPVMCKERHKKITTDSGPYAANTAMRVLRTIYNDVADNRRDRKGNSMLPENPVTGALNKRAKARKQKGWNKEQQRTGNIKPEQLRSWWKATDTIASTVTNDNGKQEPFYKRGDGALARDYLRFVLLTGLRRREAIADSLTWADIDFDNASLVIRKTKNKKVLQLPLSDYMLELLKQRYEAAADKPGPFPLTEPKRFVAKLGELSGVHTSVHDLRRSFITIANSLDIAPSKIKALVNHSLEKQGQGRTADRTSLDVTEGYIQLDLEQLREPQQRITDYILKAAGARKSAAVLAFKEQRV